MLSISHNSYLFIAPLAFGRVSTMQEFSSSNYPSFLYTFSCYGPPGNDSDIETCAAFLPPTRGFDTLHHSYQHHRAVHTCKMSKTLRLTNSFAELANILRTRRARRTCYFASMERCSQNMCLQIHIQPSYHPLTGLNAFVYTGLNAQRLYYSL